MLTGHLQRDRRSRGFFRSPKMNGGPAVQASVSPVQRGRFRLLKRTCIMSTHSPELIKRMTDVLDEIIPSTAVDERTPALITHIARCVLKAAEGRASYMTLLVVASAESGAIWNESVRAARTSISPPIKKHP
jgi:hypothetical protein